MLSLKSLRMCMLLLLLEVKSFEGGPPRREIFAKDGDDTVVALEVLVAAISTTINKAVLQIETMIILEFMIIAVGIAKLAALC